MEGLKECEGCAKYQGCDPKNLFQGEFLLHFSIKKQKTRFDPQGAIYYCPSMKMASFSQNHFTSWGAEAFTC